MGILTTTAGSRAAIATNNKNDVNKYDPIVDKPGTNLITNTHKVDQPTKATTTTGGNVRPTLKDMPGLDISPIDMPEYDAPEEGLLSFQLPKILGQDSLSMQRARTLGAQSANLRGQSRGSIGTGTIASTMMDKATPIATEDARVINEAAKLNYQTQIDEIIKNWSSDRDASVATWQNEWDNNVKTYENEMADYLADKGYDQAMAQTMITSNTNLMSQFGGYAANILTNTDISNAAEVMDWLFDAILIPGQDSNTAFSWNIWQAQ